MPISSRLRNDQDTTKTHLSHFLISLSRHQNIQVVSNLAYRLPSSMSGLPPAAELRVCQLQPRRLGPGRARPHQR